MQLANKLFCFLSEKLLDFKIAFLKYAVYHMKHFCITNVTLNFQMLIIILTYYHLFLNIIYECIILKFKMIRPLKLQYWLLVTLKARCCTKVKFYMEKGIFLQILS